MCQSMSRPGPSMNPSRDTDIIRMIFLTAGSVARERAQGSGPLRSIHADRPSGGSSLLGAIRLRRRGSGPETSLVETIDVPDTPAGRQLRWWLASIDDPESMTADDVLARCA